MKRLTSSEVKEIAQLRGLKMTPQRRAIIEFLEKAENHPTAEDILKAVNRKFPMTSRATVYNTLNWLKDSNLLQERFEGNCVRFDPNNEHHHHFVCSDCGKLEDIGPELVGDMAAFKLPVGHEVETFEVTLFGKCPKCRRQK